MATFTPYANEADVLEIGGLTLENRLDRVSIYGNLDLTRDQPGLTAALALQAALNQIVAALQASELPAQLASPSISETDNPF
ncbi:hypothetical protein [Silvimonas iriomotensis]|uniref:DUF1659 domain-containing protein n=1 Tax=Silvimonas iriomotensis TaxID=449662 RepID=A0ABQ2PBZ7_9NEIS|nr:hypothetical protein [Silvimonas iriomotensis]GGP22866.1 hypothetical protein GCM10010970_28660 [Silvimonas iriomotensis]